MANYYIIYQSNGSILIREHPPEPISYRPGDRIIECDRYITVAAIYECLQVKFDITKIPMQLIGLIRELPSEHDP